MEISIEEVAKVELEDKTQVQEEEVVVDQLLIHKDIAMDIKEVIGIAIAEVLVLLLTSLVRDVIRLGVVQVVPVLLAWECLVDGLLLRTEEWEDQVVPD